MESVLIKEKLVEAPELGSLLYLPGLPGSGSKVYDRSPYGNSGTITGATWTKLPSGIWCLSFDGIDDVVDCGNSACFNVTSALTVVAWINPVGWGGGTYGRILSKGVITAWAFFLSMTTAEMRFYGASMGSAIQSNPNVIALNKWQQVGITYNKANVRFYVNGVYQGGDALSQPLGTNIQNLLVGSESEVADRCFNGNIALVRVLNRPWTTLEFQNSFNREKHLFGVLV